MLSLMLSFAAFGEVGKVLKVLGDKDAYILRGDQKLPASLDTDLQLNDKIVSLNSHLLIHIYPATQLSLGKNSEVQVTEHLIEASGKITRASSVIDFIKGVIRVLVEKGPGEEIEQKIQAENVAFTVRGTEFEISQDTERNVDLDVVEGEVVVSSPFVQTFVPEVVKANEGFRFGQKKRSFARRAFLLRFKDHPKFESKKKLIERWRKIRTFKKRSRTK